MEEPEKQIKKGSKIFWVIFDIIFFGFYFLCCLALLDPKGTFSYYEGLCGTHYRFMILFLPLLFWYITVLYFLILLVRLFFWNRFFKNKRKRWIARIIIVAMLILCNPIVAALIVSPIRTPLYIPFTKGFQERIESRLDVNDVQVWLSTLSQSDIDKSSDRSWFEAGSFPLTMPKTLQNLSSDFSYIGFRKSEQGDVCVRLEWGGSLIGRWGVEIGPKGMPIPPTKPWTEQEHGEYRLKLADGAYVFQKI